MTSSTARRAISVKVCRLAHGSGLPLPERQTPDAAGLDLIAATPADAPVLLLPGAFAKIPTGLQLALPAGYEGQVRPRSGLAAKHGVTVLNSPGTIDADYRGEVSVLLINLGTAPVQISRGERIAQLVIAPVSSARLVEVKILDATTRGSGGFGSTGVKEKKPRNARRSGKDVSPARGSKKSIGKRSRRAGKQQSRTR